MKKYYNLLIFFTLIFIIGIIILMNSVNLGVHSVENLLISKGSLINIEMYYEQYITNYRLVGSILSIIGGLGVIKNLRLNQ